MFGFRQIELGDRGRQYVLDRLAEGHAFAQVLRRRVDRTKGQVFTYLPTEISDTAARDFGDGILGEPPEDTHILYEDAAGRTFRAVPKANTDEVLVDHILRFLAALKSSVCILEGHLNEPGGSWFKSWPGRLWILDEDLYHVVTRDDTERSIVSGAVRATARAWTFLGGVVVCPDSIDTSSGRRTTTGRELSLLSKTAQAVVVGAYEGEGYLIWTPEGAA